MSHVFLNPWVQTSLNVLLVALAYVGNLLVQGFCQPVGWALVVLQVAFFPVVFWPILRMSFPKLHLLWHFLQGIAFAICLYSLIFLGILNLYMPVMLIMGVGIPSLSLYFFTVQLFWRYARPAANWQQRGPFLFAILLMLGVGAWFATEHLAGAQIAIALRNSPKPYAGPHEAAVERVIGMHFKYHTRPEIFDGWRPPLHDPVLVIGLLITNMQDPLPIPLDERVALYQKVFPERPVIMECACANSFDGQTYFAAMQKIAPSSK